MMGFILHIVWKSRKCPTEREHELNFARQKFHMKIIYKNTEEKG